MRMALGTRANRYVSTTSLLYRASVNLLLGQSNILLFICLMVYQSKLRRLKKKVDLPVESANSDEDASIAAPEPPETSEAEDVGEEEVGEEMQRKVDWKGG